MRNWWSQLVRLLSLLRLFLCKPPTDAFRHTVQSKVHNAFEFLGALADGYLDEDSSRRCALFPNAARDGAVNADNDRKNWRNAFVEGLRSAQTKAIIMGHSTEVPGEKGNVLKNACVATERLFCGGDSGGDRIAVVRARSLQKLRDTVRGVVTKTSHSPIHYLVESITSLASDALYLEINNQSIAALESVANEYKLSRRNMIEALIAGDTVDSSATAVVVVPNNRWLLESMGIDMGPVSPFL